MLFRRRTVITFEKLERSFYCLPGFEPLLAPCDLCRAEVSWLTPNQAVALTGLSLRDIFRLIEVSKTLHFSESSQGLLHICSQSLREAQKARNEKDTARC